MPNDLSIPRMPRKQIELWDITSTSGNFGHIKSKQQTFTLKVFTAVDLRIFSLRKITSLMFTKVDKLFTCY